MWDKEPLAGTKRHVSLSQLALSVNKHLLSPGQSLALGRVRESVPQTRVTTQGTYLQLKGRVYQGCGIRGNQETLPGEVRERRLTNAFNALLRNLDFILNAAVG